jgi:hypothetical protein
MLTVTNHSKCQGWDGSELAFLPGIGGGHRGCDSHHNSFRYPGTGSEMERQTLGRAEKQETNLGLVAALSVDNLDS